jgi:hypothetical protein
MVSQTNPAQHEKLTYPGIEVTHLSRRACIRPPLGSRAAKRIAGERLRFWVKTKKRPLRVECPTHGELAVFKNFADYAETLKAVINQSNDAMGLTRIDPDAEGIFERYS